MGLLAVIGPSRKDHFGLPRFLSHRRSKAWMRFQNSTMARSGAGKSTCVSTLSNGIGKPRAADAKSLFYGVQQKYRHPVWRRLEYASIGSTAVVGNKSITYKY